MYTNQAKEIIWTLGRQRSTNQPADRLEAQVLLPGSVPQFADLRMHLQISPCPPPCPPPSALRAVQQCLSTLISR